MTTYSEKTSRDILEAVAQKLSANGIPASVVSTSEEAKEKILGMISKTDEVMTMTSATLDAIGLPQALADGGYNIVRPQLLEPDISPRRKRELGSAPDISVGSSHAVTKEGEIIIVSGTGSQLPAVAYGAGKAILVIGAQKIVENVDDAMKRVYEYILPLESARLNKLYNITTGSSVNKVLIIKKEFTPGRIQVIFVEESLGF